MLALLCEPILASDLRTRPTDAGNQLDSSYTFGRNTTGTSQPTGLNDSPIPHLTTCLPIPCLGLYPLLLPLALLGLEFNTLSMINPVCHKPLLKTHGTALGISWGRTGKRTITAVNSLAGNRGKWNITGWYINGAIHQPVLLFLLSLDIYSPLGLQIVHYGITCLAHGRTTAKIPAKININS